MNDGLVHGGAPSSSSQSPPEPHHDGINDAPRGSDTADIDLLGENNLNGSLAEPISFKRKQRARSASGLGLITSLTGLRPGSQGGPRPGSSSNGGATEDTSILEDIHTSPGRRGGANGDHSSTAKAGAPLDWYVEGPGRRVGYEDLTAIDWIFEYTKERTRLRVLNSSGSGLLGYAQRLLDASQEWIILVLTGLLVGALAAGIDITTDWLGDLKTGYCSTQDGGAFYLNKHFCCLGYDEGAQCMGWRPWAAALHVSSRGGKWVIEYFFFIMLSVWSFTCTSKFPSLQSIY